MSYSRFIEADVYVFMSVGGWLECCGCWLAEEEEGMAFRAFTTDAMIKHLKRHEETGFHVPEGIYDELRADDEINFGNAS